MNARPPTPDPDRDLRLTLELKARCDRIWQCWQDPELLRQWFTPQPWTCDLPELDLRTGGHLRLTMRGPDGEVSPVSGRFLEVIPGQRLVMTDAYTDGWNASDKPFMTLILTLDALDAGRTRYDALVKHWSPADRDAHAEMGFTDGWTLCIRQLETLAHSLEAD